MSQLFILICMAHLFGGCSSDVSRTFGLWHPEYRQTGRTQEETLRGSLQFFTDHSSSLGGALQQQKQTSKPQTLCGKHDSAVALLDRLTSCRLSDLTD